MLSRQTSISSQRPFESEPRGQLTKCEVKSNFVHVFHLMEVRSGFLQKLRDLPQLNDLFYEELLSLSLDILINNCGPPNSKIIPLLQLRLKLLPLDVTRNLQSFLGTLMSHLRLDVKIPSFDSWKIRMLVALRRKVERRICQIGEQK